MPEQTEHEFLRVSEFAAALGVTNSCILRWIREKKLTVIKLGRLTRIPRTEIARIVQAGTRPAKKGIIHADGC